MANWERINEYMLRRSPEIHNKIEPLYFENYWQQNNFQDLVGHDHVLFVFYVIQLICIPALIIVLQSNLLQYVVSKMSDIVSKSLYLVKKQINRNDSTYHNEAFIILCDFSKNPRCSQQK